MIDDGGDMNFGLNLYGLTKNLIKKIKKLAFDVKLYKNHGELWKLVVEFFYECK